MTTRSEISGWFDAGVTQKATHMLVVCDDFDMDDYPVYVYSGEDVHDAVEEKTGSNMQRLIEVYALHLSKEMQINEFNAHHYEYPKKETAE